MDIKSKILFTAFILAGLLSASVLFVSERPKLANRFVREGISRYGELFNMSKVKGFGKRLADPPVPVSECPPKHDINEAEVIVLGDSFVLDKYYGWDIGKVLERNSGMKTFVYHSTRAGVYESPTDTLEKLGLEQDSPLKYVVMVYTERFRRNMTMYNFMKRELSEGNSGQAPVPKAVKPAGATVLPGGGMLDGFKEYLINDKALEYAVTENAAMHWALVLRNTFRLRYFGEISRKTPVYSEDPPMLHYHQDIAANRREVPDNYYDDVARYLKQINGLIEKRYGGKLVFMAVPSKYTLCGYDYEHYNYNVSGESYDGFIPRLNADLEEHGVMHVDLYGPFMGKAEAIYEPHHAHWNYVGMDIAAKELMRLMEPD